jgi:hypothetical protein
MSFAPSFPSPLWGEVSASYADGGVMSIVGVAPDPSVADYRDTSPETGEGPRSAD